MKNIWWNIYAIPWFHFVFIALIFILFGWQKSIQVAELSDGTVWDVLIISLSGPPFGALSFISLISWSIFYISFLYIIGDLANADLLTRSDILVYRLGGRRIWWINKLITLTFLTIFHTSIFFLSILLGASFHLPVTFIIHPEILALTYSGNLEHLFIQIFVVVSTTLLSLAFLQVIISIICRKSFYAFIVVNCLLLFSFILGSHQFAFLRWLPGIQSVLLWHTLFSSPIQNFSLYWSIFYNLGLIIILITMSSFYIGRIDIFSDTTHN